MKYIEYLNKLILDKINLNMCSFNKYLESKDCEYKVNQLKIRNPDLDLSNIINDARSGNIYAICLLRKDVLKQNISENAFFEFTGFTKLPQTGSNRIVFGDSKAADFKINDWFGTQKYIKQYGGAQDNQINDTITFAKEGIKLGKKIIICIDGESAEHKVRSKIKESLNLVICNTDRLMEYYHNGRFN